MRLLNKRLATAAVLLTLCTAVAALPSDREQPITYQADRAQRDHQQGTTTLEGSVIMERGSIRIEAEKVIIEDQDNKVSVVIALGSPARYRQIPEVGAEPVIASAERLEYRLGEQSLSLVGKASLVQGGSSLSGDRIDYDARLAVVKAGSDELNRTERVRMVIPAKALQSGREDEAASDAPPGEPAPANSFPGETSQDGSSSGGAAPSEESPAVEPEAE